MADHITGSAMCFINTQPSSLVSDEYRQAINFINFMQFLQRTLRNVRQQQNQTQSAEGPATTNGTTMEEPETVNGERSESVVTISSEQNQLPMIGSEDSVQLIPPQESEDDSAQVDDERKQ